MTCPEDIQSVVLISDDAIGLVTKSLVVTRLDGAMLHYEGHESIREFSAELRNQAPGLADLIEQELDAAGNPNNYEFILFDRAG
jgi:hypothetical protein